jgi:hypothetical protein
MIFQGIAPGRPAQILVADGLGNIGEFVEDLDLSSTVARTLALVTPAKQFV